MQPPDPLKAAKALQALGEAAVAAGESLERFLHAWHEEPVDECKHCPIKGLRAVE